MRLRPVVAALAGLGLGAVGIGVTAVSAAAETTPASAALNATAHQSGSQSDYEWGNVEIVGGGFVPGIIYSEAEEGLAYVRTDVGGAYRREAGETRWTPLGDHIGWDDWNHSGVLSLAADPTDADNVYVMVGSYTNDWDPDNGAVLRSSDRGETWSKTDLPFKVGGNMPGRGMGERLAVDPNDSDVLYMGTEGGEGLWRSTDRGVTWSEVTEFPNPGNYVQDPDDPYGYLDSNQGVLWVKFDPAGAAEGAPSNTIYVGVADKENNLYRSTDAGETWERVPDQPTGFIPHKGILDLEGDQLYMATSDTGGPYDGGLGDVWRMDTATGEWTRISPVSSEDPDAFHGYSGLAIDRQNPDTIMVVSQIIWWPDIQIYRSTDRGETWSQIWDWGNYPERDRHYTLDTSGSPWLDFGHTDDPDSPRIGWMTESFEIDPFNSDNFLYGTGATVFGGENLTAWDKEEREPVNIGVRAQGIEETAVRDVAAPPGDVDLISGMADIGGFVHDDVDTVPDRFHYTDPFQTGVYSVDFAQNAPDTFIRTGNADRDESRLGVSTDAGDSWKPAVEPDGVSGPGVAAVNADGSRILWSPDGTGVHVSADEGETWTASSDVPAGARVEADRNDPERFYAVAEGTFYVSTDGGESFTASEAGGLPTGDVKFGSVPGEEGEIFLAGSEDDEEENPSPYGMWHSTDGGATFERVAGLEEADTVGFGAPAPGRSYPAIYTSAKADGVRGLFRSDDAGSSWVRINDDEHQFAWTGGTISGDPDVYGRVYVGTNGRGIVMGDLAGPAPSCTADFRVVSDWGKGFLGEVTVTSTATETLGPWTIDWSLGADMRISSGWFAGVKQDGALITAASRPWNSDLEPGESKTIGFVSTMPDGATPSANGIRLNGAVCGSTS